MLHCGYVLLACLFYDVVWCGVVVYPLYYISIDVLTNLPQTKQPSELSILPHTDLEKNEAFLCHTLLTVRRGAGRASASAGGATHGDDMDVNTTDVWEELPLKTSTTMLFPTCNDRATCKMDLIGQ